VLHLAAGPRAHGVGSQESERVDVVAAVLGEVQTHLAHDMPQGVPRPQPLRDGSAMGVDLVGERAVEIGPARRNPVGVDVLAAVHGRDGAGQPAALVRGAVDLDALASILEVRHGTETGDERAAEVAQESQGRSEGSVELGRTQVEQGMSGPARERAEEADASGGRQSVARLVVAGCGVREQRAGRQDGHTHRTKCKRWRRPAQPVGRPMTVPPHVNTLKRSGAGSIMMTPRQPRRETP
jgi:hypothetical protein